MAIEANGRARGRIKKDPKTITLNMRMGESTYEWLAREAEKRGLTVSALARMFVIQKLSEEGGEPPYDTVILTGGPELAEGPET